MYKAKTLKRGLENSKSFLSVAWDTDDIQDPVFINPNIQWRDINWKTVEKYVFKLQKLIYRASSRGEIRKMRKYQRLMTSSYYARLLAVRYATQDNQCQKTAGRDGIKHLPPMQLLNLVDFLRSRYLKGSPTRRVWITKPGKDEKCLSGIPAMYDRALQTLVKLGMEPEWEVRFEPNSYGFSRMSIHDAIEAIYESIKRKPKYVLDADISKCFEGINYGVLLEKVGQSPYRGLIKQWLNSGVLDKKQFCLPFLGLGTPQEEVIRPLLVNIALHGIEERLKEFIDEFSFEYSCGKAMGKQNQRKSLSLITYADHFLILHEDIKIVLQVKALIQEWLSQIGLELKPETIRIAHTLEEYEGNTPGFDFLGFTVRQWQVKTPRQRFKTVITPSSKSIKTHYRKLAEICDFHKNAPVEALIAKLNPVIRGWANYYSTVASKKAYRKLDSLLGRRLGRWANRRHPNKSATWVKKKYFSNIQGTRSWILNNGEYILKQHSDVSIVGHIKVNGNESMLEGDWIYWNSRFDKYPGVNTEVRKLLKSQKNKCAFCGITFRPTDIIEIDYIIPRSKGGDNTYKNKQLLHRHCRGAKTALDNKTYPKLRLQDLPDGYLWVDDMLILK